MRLATFRPSGSNAPRAGDVRGDHILGFDDGVTVEALIRSGARPEPSGPVYRLAEVDLLAPYVPRVVFGVGLNYPRHVAEGGVEIPEQPMIFMKGPASVTGPSGPVVRPPSIEQLDYEGELAVVVGPRREIAGYAIANDVSARELMESQLTRHKGGDTFCPWGPWVTTADELGDVRGLRLRTWVDGELRQDANTDDMIFGPHEVIDAIARTIEPRAGDVIIMGTPEGVGWALEPQRWLQPGSRVRIEIDQLGVIEHEIVQGRGERCC